ncbi:MAG: magnesium/cobalt transporter CorA [Candidatus Omnitrophota bacterium]|jgi:magnesium transporter
MLTSFVWKKGVPIQSNVTRSQMLAALGDKDSLLWVDLDQPNEFESDALVEIFNFHPLAVEDCLTDHSQPKLDDYEEYLFLVMHVRIKQDEVKKTEELITIELNIFFGRNYVVTFHTADLKSIQTMQENIRRKPERYMGQGCDVLVHGVLDQLVDNYQPVLDLYDDKIDRLEDEIFNNPPSNYLSTLMQVKQDIFNLKRIVSPQRDTVGQLVRNPTNFIRTKHLMYFRDVSDHLIRIYTVAEGLHENLSNILQVYFSYSSVKLNEVVKHLTVLATLTMPPLIIASIYGMNFKHMPELSWQHGYTFALMLSLVTSSIMLLWMKMKKWL